MTVSEYITYCFTRILWHMQQMGRSFKSHAVCHINDF